MKNISNKIKQIEELINASNYILIGAGAGLSTSAGIEYSGKRFTDNFEEFIKKYHFTDMYTSSFYEFETEEEKWAYWARHIYTNNTGMSSTKLYQDILKLVKNKEYFVITTNVDDQFYKAGFDKERIFATQGSYKYIQCSMACHNKLYDDAEIVNKMLKRTVDCKIPTELVPKCPVCGEPMDVNLRKDSYFVQDNNWYKQNKKYEEFLNKAKNEKVIVLEFGVGFNTPGIIRFPFEQMTLKNEKWTLIRFNKEDLNIYLEINDRYIGVSEDIGKVVNKIIRGE